jgi:glycosyltransferase involved in cell wall biosynthesis
MNLLLVAVWFRRGHTYVAVQARDALLRAGHRVHVLARTGHIEGTPAFDDRDELGVDGGEITRVPRYLVDADDFRALLGAQRFDGVVFVEEQWQPELGAVTRALGIPSVNVVMWEFFHPGDPAYANFNLLVFPVRCGAQRAARAGYRSVHVPWGVDLDLWGGGDDGARGDGDGVQFFHCSGWGGGHARKQTEFVVEAFQKVRRPGARLLVHRQTLAAGVTRARVAPNIEVLTGNLARAEVAALYRQSDCALAPSKWEGLGFSLLEPQAAGVPVVTLDCPPMNEVVEHARTGVLLPVDRFERYPGIAVPAALADEARFVECLESLVDQPEKLAAMGEQARRSAQDRFDWERNGLRFVDVVERTVADPPPPGRRPSAQIARMLRP